MSPIGPKDRRNALSHEIDKETVCRILCMTYSEKPNGVDIGQREKPIGDNKAGQRRNISIQDKKMWEWLRQEKVGGKKGTKDLKLNTRP